MWTTLKTAEDWAAYQERTAKALQVLSTRINWGNGPASYPCLVSTLFPPRAAGTEPKAYSAFVYEADAEELMKSAGRRFLDLDQAPPPNQAQFNRWVTAEVLAIVHFLVETGICKKDQFEHKLLESIDLVDKYATAEREKLRETLTPAQVSVLDTLDPPR